MSSVYFILLALVALQKFSGRIRSSLLQLILSIIYFLIMTPMALMNRFSPRNKLSTWKDTAATGWHKNEQSTSDPRTFSGSSSTRGELAAMKGNGKYTIAAYDILRPLKGLSKSQEEKELSTDLYVMF